MVAEPLVRVDCAVCGGAEHERISTAAEVEAQLAYLRRFHKRRLRAPSEQALADRAEFTQDYATDVVQCRECGLLFRNPRPTERAVARAYSQDTYGHQRLAAMFESQVELYRPKARSLRPWLRPGARVVEAGSFVGGFLAAGREKGWDMLGVDPGREVESFCVERGLPVFSGTLPDLLTRPPRGWEPGSADGVAIWNTFDQLPDAEPTLRAATALLRPGGLLTIRVPNGACFRMGACWMRRLPEPWGGWLRAGLAWNNLLAFPYLYGYSARTLDWLLSWHGFRRVAVTPDTLCRLADEQTRPWASWEERALKLAIRIAASCEGLVRRDSPAVAPWLDVYYRRET